MKKGVDKNLLEFNKGQCKILYLGRSSAMYLYKWDETGTYMENDLMVISHSTPVQKKGKRN